MRAIVPGGMASLVEIVVLPNFTKLADNMRTVTLHKIMERNKYPGARVGPRQAFLRCTLGDPGSHCCVTHKCSPTAARQQPCYKRVGASAIMTSHTRDPLVQL